MDSYATATSNQLRYNEFGNGIQWNSLKNWGTSVSTQLISDHTTKIFRTSAAKGSNNSMVAQWYNTGTLTSTGFTL